MTSSRLSGSPFETPPRQQSANLTVLQSPYSPPTQVQRVPPTSIFSTPQSKTATPATGNTPSQQPPQQQQSTPAPAAQTPAARGPETPKVGGKWVHPALQGIDREARKFIFGEEELKRLVVNVILLYSMWWISSKLGDSDAFEDIVRFVRRSPKISFGLQLITWSLRSLFIFNIATSLLPLLRPKSRPLTNIPLTPAQRELIGLDKTDVTPIATSIKETITPPRYKASPSGGSRPSPSLTPSRADSPRSVSVGTPSPAQRQLNASGNSSFGTYSTPIQSRPRSSSGLSGRRLASGVGGSPLGIGASPLATGPGVLESPASRKASMEVFFRG